MSFGEEHSLRCLHVYFVCFHLSSCALLCALCILTLFEALICSAVWF